MATISATSNPSTSIQASLAKTRLAQARREADQAQTTADDLQAKADSADRYAQKTRSTVRDMAANNRDLDATYERQLRNTSKVNDASDAAAISPARTQGLLAGFYSAVNQANAIKGAANEKSTSPFIIVSSPGPSTGRIVNVTA